MNLKNKKAGGILSIALFVVGFLAVAIALVIVTWNIRDDVDRNFIGPAVVETASATLREVRFDEFYLENKSFYRDKEYKIVPFFGNPIYNSGETRVSFTNNGRQLSVFYREKPSSPALINVTYFLE